ncbi:MAG: DedA family protein [Gammaproteobacteria bacterium]|nr:YqaA family protein [Gammaproteobacteria bacterium]
MRWFSPLYERGMRWAGHPHAPRYLFALAFAEASFFPLPPDVMLAPMALATPARAWRFALIATTASVLGGVLGYLIGHFAFELVEPLLHQWGYWESYQRAAQWFDRWGFWAVFLAGFSPIPYKVFTIGAGVAAMSVLPFLVASFVGRGGRFFLVAGLMAWGGERMENLLRRYIDRIGWLLVIVAVGVYLILRH